MSDENKTLLDFTTTSTDRIERDKEIIIEQIWIELEGKIAHSIIEQLVSEVIQKYAEVPIQTYIPILVHKEVVERLRSKL